MCLELGDVDERVHILLANGERSGGLSEMLSVRWRVLLALRRPRRRFLSFH